MEITETRIYPKKEKRLAYVTITLNNIFVFYNLFTVVTDNSVKIFIPSKKISNETHKGVAYPIFIY